MKIRLNEIPKEGLSVKEACDANFLDLARDDLKFISPIDISAFLVKERDDLYAHVNAKGRLQMICARCLSGHKTRDNFGISIKTSV